MARILKRSRIHVINKQYALQRKGERKQKLLKIQLMRKFKFLFFLFGRTRNSCNWAAFYTDCWPGDQFCHFLSLQWISDPVPVKVERTFGNTLSTISICINTGVSTMSKLEELVLRLIVGTSIANSRNWQLCVLDAVVLCSTFAEGSSISSDNCWMSLPNSKNRMVKNLGSVVSPFGAHAMILLTYKIGIDAVEARCICNCNVDLVAPRHSLADLHLLLFRRVPKPREIEMHKLSNLFTLVEEITKIIPAVKLTCNLVDEWPTLLPSWRSLSKFQDSYHRHK